MKDKENTQQKPLLGVAIEPNSSESSKHNETIQRTEVKDSPFEIITIDGRSFGVMGKYRITEHYNSIESCRKELKRVTWNRIIQITMLLIETKEEMNKNTQTTTK